MYDTLQRQFNEAMDIILKEYSDEGRDTYTFHILMSNYLKENGFEILKGSI